VSTHSGQLTFYIAAIHFRQNNLASSLDNASALPCPIFTWRAICFQRKASKGI
jgi:hypothetical protein